VGGRCEESAIATGWRTRKSAAPKMRYVRCPCNDNVKR
jgi:hypothetical protein